MIMTQPFNPFNLYNDPNNKNPCSHHLTSNKPLTTVPRLNEATPQVILNEATPQVILYPL